MKKAPKIEYGIEIVKPWSKAMYDHNDKVADVVHDKVAAMLAIELSTIFSDYWEDAPDSLIKIQKAITGYGFGFGYTIGRVTERVWDELHSAPYYRLKEIAEELELELEKGFVGF
jgi:hypothetical protein